MGIKKKQKTEKSSSLTETKNKTKYVPFNRRFLFGKKIFITGVTLLSCLLMFSYKYYEILSLHNEKTTLKQSNTLFATRLIFGRTRSRWTGKLLSIHIPPPWRLFIYNYCIYFLKINKEEIKYPLESYKSISELFSRFIKEETRPVDNVGSHSIVSPCDSEIKDFGEIKGEYIERIKGIKFNIQEFLGSELKKKYNDGSTKFYYAVFYLSPQKYHHFHAPFHFYCKIRRHISGEIFPLFDGMFKFINNLFNMNERVILSGEWAGGNIYYAAISAYNVGNISIVNETNFVTNKNKTQLSYLGGDIDTNIYDPNDPKNTFEIGDEIGEFKLGSSVVLIFENKHDFEWKVKKNQTVRVGQFIGGFPDEVRKPVKRFITIRAQSS